MTTNHEHLREVAERATPQDFDSAEIVAKDGWIECPCCSGEGSVELTADYCNYDNEAIGVQFYGVGHAYVNAEEFYRTFNPATAIALLDELAALRKENEGLKVDKDRLDWLDGQSESYGFENYHEGNRWTLDGPFNTARQAIDATREHFAARAAIGDNHE